MLMQRVGHQYSDTRVVMEEHMQGVHDTLCRTVNAMKGEGRGGCGY